MPPDPSSEVTRRTRRFNASQRTALYLAADGFCESCGVPLKPGWHGDHVVPWSTGGFTDIVNGQALCPQCNLKKGTKSPMQLPPLRDWQNEAISKATSIVKTDYLITATPGAGKTTFALALAHRLRQEGRVTRVVVIAPTDALREQWADSAADAGLDLMPVKGAEDYDKAGYVGCVATYAQIANEKGIGQSILRRVVSRIPTLVILDEVHHAGEKRAYGDSLKTALADATVRLCLTGTPWRKRTDEPIPFVDYLPSGLVSVDFAYEYGQAVLDGVCRRIEFHAYTGEAKWVDCGVMSTAQLGADMSDDDVAAALDAAYDPTMLWMPALLQKAIDALEEVRLDVADAGGLVVAADRRKADAYAELLYQLSGERPVVAHGDEEDPKAVIEAYKKGRSKWIVAVQMVSEGVDIPRLAVGVYASKYRTPLFFRQVVGRFVRTRKGEELNAQLFMPAVPALMMHAKAIEDELRHQLDLEEKKLAEREQRDATAQGELSFRVPVGASAAEHHGSFFGGDEATPAEKIQCEDRARAMKLPEYFALNLLPLIRELNGAGTTTTAVLVPTDWPIEIPRFRMERQRRSELDGLAGKLARKWMERDGLPIGQAKKTVNTALLKAGFGTRDTLSLEQVHDAIEQVENWLMR